MIPISCTILSSEVLDDQFKKLSITLEAIYDCHTTEGECSFAPLTSDLCEWDLERCQGLQVLYDAVSAHRDEHWTEEFRDSYRDYIIDRNGIARDSDAVEDPVPE